MTRRCVVTQKQAMVGNNVSHSNRKTRRRFQANVQYTSLYSETLKRNVALRISAAGLRTVDHKGGLDAYLLGTAPSKLDETLRPVRAQIKAAQAKQA